MSSGSSTKNAGANTSTAWRRTASAASLHVSSPFPLQRLAADEARRVAGEPHRVAHQEPLERRQTVNRREAEIAGEAQRRKLVREQTVEPVGHGGEGESVEVAPPLVVAEQVGIADVETEPAPVDHQLSERRDVADAKIEALTGDRMDDVRGFADQCLPFGDVALGQHQAQRIRPARPNRLNRTKEIAEA